VTVAHRVGGRRAGQRRGYGVVLEAGVDLVGTQDLTGTRHLLAAR
jgi:hypothetical protein